MATQQGAPSRPWFRIATMVRPPPPPPTPQPDQQPPAPPRPAFIRPAFSQTFRAPPTVPPPQTTTTTPPVAVSPPRPTATPATANGVPPTSPPQQQPQPAIARATQSPSSSSSSSSARSSPLQTSRPPSPAPVPITPHAPPPPQPTYSPNPKTIKPMEKITPPSSPIKPLSHPPSPLALPSPQLKPEYEHQKTMVVQETKQNPKNLDNNNGFNGHDIHARRSGARNTKKPETAKKQYSDSEDAGMRIITIAGENKGAIMELSPFGKKTHSFGDNPHKLGMKKDNPTDHVLSDGEKSGSNSDGKSKPGNKNHKSKSPLMNAVMNSNVQGVNNSILYNCSTSHHDPGVHLSLSRKPMGFNSKLKHHIN